MEKQNCWEVLKCGREQGGQKVDELGICQAAVDINNNNVNSGRNGGRICWSISGTLCGGEAQGTFAEKKLSCLSCEFIKKVVAEEGPEKFTLLPSS